MLSNQISLLFDAIHTNQNLQQELEATYIYLTELEDNIEKNEKALFYFRVTFPFLLASNLLKKELKDKDLSMLSKQILYRVTTIALTNLNEGRKETIKILNSVFNNS